ncbi:MAG: IS110 family transposase [Syntrophobacteraceae bacterium]
MEAMINNCAGLDVHRRQVVCTLIQDTKRTTREYPTFSRELKELARWLQREQVGLAVMESTGIYWKAVFACLEAAGIEGRVVNARHVKQVPGRKTDVCDSEWLAELAQFGLLRPSFIPPRDLRELRLLTRYRRKLSGILAGEKNRLHKVLDDAGIRLGSVVSDIDGVSARAMVEALIEGGSTPEQIAEKALGRLQKKKDALELALEGEISDRHRLVLQKMLGHVKWLRRQIAVIDGQIVAAMKPYQEEWKLLQTIPGLDVVSAAMLIAETGVDMSRFGSKDRLCSWAGICPGNNESAGKRKSGRTRKANPYVRSLLCEIANSARKTQSQFQGLYKGLVIRRGHKRAVVAVGHRILQIVYIILSRKEPYRDPEIDYEALVVHRNAPRWLKALQKYGYLTSIVQENH